MELVFKLTHRAADWDRCWWWIQEEKWVVLVLREMMTSDFTYTNYSNTKQIKYYKRGTSRNVCWMKGLRANLFGMIRKGILEGYFLRWTLKDRKKFDGLWQQWEQHEWNNISEDTEVWRVRIMIKKQYIKQFDLVTEECIQGR